MHRPGHGLLAFATCRNVWRCLVRIVFLLACGRMRRERQSRGLEISTARGSLGCLLVVICRGSFYANETLNPSWDQRGSA